MKIKTKFGYIEIELILIIIINICLFSNVAFKFLYYFFACYLFIFFHELMHITVGTMLGKKLLKVKLSISGVCATFKKEKLNDNKINNLKEMMVYFAGPFSNILLALLFKNINMIRDINIFLAVLNLIPIFPLDGYNILINSMKLINIKNEKKYVNKISDCLIIFLFIISVFLLIRFTNFSLSVFTIYLFVLKINSKNTE